VLKISGDETEQAAQKNPIIVANDGQSQRVANGFEDLLSDRRPAGDGVPEITLKRAPDPGQELLGIARSKAVEFAQLLPAVPPDASGGRIDTSGSPGARCTSAKHTIDTPSMIGSV
jgi:hypothetical protein